MKGLMVAKLKSVAVNRKKKDQKEKNKMTKNDLQNTT